MAAPCLLLACSQVLLESNKIRAATHNIMVREALWGKAPYNTHAGHTRICACQPKARPTTATALIPAGIPHQWSKWDTLC
jgi:hypothetical protein